ncbi:MAG: carboxypeptidase regulatory-like domain-containing protein [Planctomycetota bacterium]|nr:MAG: carboxypeptidase regulatory-like domain-containing protein [Planctomycetota bacterium]
MPNVFEGDSVRCTLRLTGPVFENAKNAEFVFLNKKDKSEVGRQKAELSAGKGTCEWVPPKVADVTKDPDALSYEVYYQIEYEADGTCQRAMGFAEDITVWTRQVKITAKDPDGKPLPEAKIEVYQGDTCEEGNRTVRRTDSQGTFTFDLRQPAKVLVQFLAPYNLLEWLKGDEQKGRERECKVEKKPYKAEIWSHPAATGKVRHYVNLPESADEPHHGHLLKLRVGAKGDKGKREGLSAQPGDKIHFRIKLSEVKRSDPEVCLKVNGVKVPMPGDREWKGEAELRADSGEAYKPVELDLELGYEGGVQVEIKVGATPDCADQTLTLETWRRLYYELMAPQMLTDKLNAAGTWADGTTGYDLPTAIRSKVTERLAPAFIEYLCHKAHVYADGKAPQGTVYPAAYFGESGDPLLVLCPATALTEPIPFDGGKGKQEIRVLACDKSYYGRSTDAKANMPELHAATATVRASDPGLYVFPYSMANGRKGTIDVSGCEWEALIDDPSPYRVRLEFGPGPQAGDVPAGIGGGKALRVRAAGRDVVVRFAKPRLGNVKTNLAPEERTKIQNFARDLRDALAAAPPTGAALAVSVHGDSGNARRLRRFENVKQALQTAFDALPAVYAHPGLKADGNPKTGPVQLGWFKYKDHHNVEINLPRGSEPGSFVGGLSATSCPVLVEFEILQAFGINGAAWDGRQILCLRTDAPGSCASTVCHELGHSMGMTIMAGRSKEPPGLPPAKHVDNGGVYYLNGTPVGNGLRNSHVGPHCATGVEDLTQPSFAGASGNCILFGEGGAKDTRPNFCETCIGYLKARRLTDIVSDWNSRAADEY